MTALVVDASVVVTVISGVTPPRAITRFRESDLHAPAHLPMEVDSALRGLERGGRVTGARVTAMRRVAVALPVQLWPWSDLAERAWELRHNVTTYDAAYVALAERIDAVLLTGDGRLARAPGIRCDVEVV